MTDRIKDIQAILPWAPDSGHEPIIIRKCLRFARGTVPSSSTGLDALKPGHPEIPTSIHDPVTSPALVSVHVRKYDGVPELLAGLTVYVE